MKKAVVVAHPDDETLWAGGLIARNPGITVVCCSIPRRDPIRAEKFINACQVLGAIPRLIMVEESDPHSPLPGVDLLDLEEFDHIYTHGAQGEYGHFHHIHLHRHIFENYRHKRLTFFGYEDGEHRINLSWDEIFKKYDALKKYDHTTEFDRCPKWKALLNKYKYLNFGVETYDGAAI